MDNIENKTVYHTYGIDDKNILLEKIRVNGGDLEYASARLRADKEVVMEALNTCAFALGSASRELQDDKEVVMKAVKNDGYALRSASSRLQDDKEVVLEAVRNGNALWCASSRLKDDRDVVMEAVKRNGTVLKEASDRLKNDPEIVMNALKEICFEEDPLFLLDEVLECVSIKMKEEILKTLLIHMFSKKEYQSADDLNIQQSNQSEYYNQFYGNENIYNEDEEKRTRSR